MSVFKKIKTGLVEAIEQEKSPSKSPKARIRTRELRVIPVEDFSAAEVRRLRLSMQLNQEQFAALLGVSPETVAKWEQGYNSPARSSVRLLHTSEPPFARRLLPILIYLKVVFDIGQDIEIIC